jgi:translation initiation factor 2B subunit (eIF-2B alpha/beta/delta family)
MLRDGMRILVHSYSRAVAGVLKYASERGIRITVITTESQPYLSGKIVKEICDNN